MKDWYPPLFPTVGHVLCARCAMRLTVLSIAEQGLRAGQGMEDRRTPTPVLAKCTLASGPLCFSVPLSGTPTPSLDGRMACFCHSCPRCVAILLQGSLLLTPFSKINPTPCFPCFFFLLTIISHIIYTCVLPVINTAVCSYPWGICSKNPSGCLWNPVYTVFSDTDVL